MSIGQNLRDIRNQKNKSLRDVEAETGINRGYLSRLERDQIPNAPFSRLKELAEYYDVDIMSIVKEDAEEDLKTKLKKENVDKPKKEEKIIKRSYYLTKKQVKMILKLNAEYVDKDMSQLVGEAIEEYYEFNMAFKD
jgi:transcriptional regulator with XRE-family HTH domain